MDVKTSESVLKALADPSRILIMNSLMEGPLYAEALCARLNLAASTMTHHLKKLEEAKLVVRTRDQYYAMYSANLELLELRLRELIGLSETSVVQQNKREIAYRLGVLKTFMRQGRIEQMPIQKKKRRILLEEIVSRFLPQHRYSENEVNAIIREIYDDYCTIRRECIDEQLMERDRESYWVAMPMTPTLPMKKERTMASSRMSELKRHYKENPPVSGIYQITNTANGKILIGRGLNVQGILNSQEAQLKFRSHMNKGLQADYDRFGREAFRFDIIDTLKESDGTRDIREELVELEMLWLEKLQPFGENGYNSAPKI